jgi:hypothetical protein
MPIGGDPPPVLLPQSVVNALSAMTYSSTNKAFRDAQNNNVYLFVEKDANDRAQWFYATNTDGGKNPRGEIPQLTASVIIDGSYNSQTSAISYNGSNYKIRLERDTSTGVPIAKAYTV